MPSPSKQAPNRRQKRSMSSASKPKTQKSRKNPQRHLYNSQRAKISTKRASSTLATKASARFTPIAKPQVGAYTARKFATRIVPSSASVSQLGQKAASAFAPFSVVDNKKKLAFAMTPLSSLMTPFSASVDSPFTTIKANLSTLTRMKAPIHRHAAAQFFNNTTPVFNTQTAQPDLQLTPFYTSVRSFAADKKKAAKAPVKKKPEEEPEHGEEAFASAGDVKKNLRNWLEQILTSKPEVTPLPQAAIDNEELFVKECQTRFAQRLDKRSRYEQAKIILKQRAIEQLPGELKTKALKDDPALWSMQIMTPVSHPPRKRWLMEHYGIPFKPTAEELESEEFLKKKYARL